MKKLILAAAVATTLLAPQAFAQGKSFEGFSVGLSANFNNMKTEFSSQSPSDTSTTAGIKAAYGWALGSNFILGLGASYDLGNAKAGSAPALNVSAVGKDLTVVSVEPGFKVANDTLVYAKLGYATVKGQLEGASTASETYNGTSFGIGVRTMLNKNWSADLEAQQLNFMGKYSTGVASDIKPSATIVSLGLNYHF